MRTISRIFLPFFMVWMLIAPVKSYAVLPLVVPLISAITGGGVLTALDTLGIGVAVTGIAYILGTSVPPVELFSNPNQALPTPTGWTPPVAPAVQPTPPSSIPAPAAGTAYAAIGVSASMNFPAPVGVINLTGDFTYNSFCSAAGGATAPPTNYCVVNGVSEPGYTFSKTYGCNGSDFYNINTGMCSPSVACPPGYGLSGSTCAITNASLVKKPPSGTCFITRTGNTFAVDPMSSDCGSSPAGVGYSVNGNTVGFNAADGSRASAQVNADGSMTITETLPSAAGVSPATTTTTTVGLGVPDMTTGTTPVGGVGQTTTMGTGTQNNPAASAPPLNMPTDYNREATQQAIEADLNVVASTPILDSVSSDIQTLTGDSAIIPKFDRTGLTGQVNLPASDGTCTPLTITYHGAPWVWDYCELVTYLHPLIDFFFSALFGILALQTLFKRKEI